MLIDHVNIARRFQRSIRLDSDVGRLEALQGFVCQRSAAEGLLNMATQVSQTSQRAFTWTGPYGGGKSSLAVTLAALLGPKGPVHKAALAALGGDIAPQILNSFKASRDGWLVVPVVGRRGDAIADIGAALEHARREAGANHGRPRAEVKNGRELLERLTKEAEARPKDGVLLIIDELGKFLESAAAEGGDIYFFQELAEIASRCKGRLVVVGVLHQSFEQYATRLGRETRDEWAKIQGRFIDIPLVTAVDEVIGLLGQAIGTHHPHAQTLQASDSVARSIRTRRPGTPTDMGARLNDCWPLHPVTAAVLGPMSRRRFGQNERSVFGFLASAEPAGFQEFLRATPIDAGQLFGPQRFWDYLRANLEPAILASNDSHRWAQAADAIERCEARGTKIHVDLAKSIALIDMFRNGSGLAADRTTLETCVPYADKDAIDAALTDLTRWSVAVFRKHMDSWAIFAGSDFDIDSAVAAAAAQITGLDLERLAKLAALQPVLAKRHYHETGTLRWFQTELRNLADLGKVGARASDAAGYFILALPDQGETREAAQSACKSFSAQASEQLIAIGLPRNALRIRELGNELVALEAVRASRPELEGDPVARREIAARISAVSADLEEELRHGFSNAAWYEAGKRLKLDDGSSLSKIASGLADKRFEHAPKIHSELLNRQKPSSNTQGGVRALAHAMVKNANQPTLGIEGFPVERGLYATVLAAAGLHREIDGEWRFAAPANTGIGQSYVACWDAAAAIIAGQKAPVSLKLIYDAWEAPPFGIRRGIMPVLALAFIMANQNSLALYSEGRFQVDIDDYFVDVLLQDEGLVGLRKVNDDAFHGAILDGVAQAITVTTKQVCSTEPLDIARRLVKFVRDLPQWTQRTLNFSAKTLEVRRVLLRADDPYKALFVDLPAVFENPAPNAIASGIEHAFHELDDAYPNMLVLLEGKMLAALGASKDSLEDLRRRASIVSGVSGDLRLDAFAGRITAYDGEFTALESIASLAINRPPRDWNDRDPDQAALALAGFGLKFRQAETLALVKGRNPSRQAMALVIGTGDAGGAVIEEFEVADSDRPKIDALARQLNKVLTQSGADRNLILAALAESGLQAALAHQQKKKAG